MKRNLCVLLILIFVSLTSFTVMRNLALSVCFENIETNTDSLKLEFKINYPDSKKRLYSSGRIEIFKNDSLFVRLIADSIKIPIDLWKFPSIPSEYRIAYPEATEKLPYFSKTDKYKFTFSVFGFYIGTWEYKPHYSNKKSRWLFDELGNQIVIIENDYEPWLLGKDIIKIKSSENFLIENLDVRVLDEKNKNLEFEVKYTRNPTNIIILKLQKREKKGAKLKLIIQFDKDKHYEECILVPDRGIVGVVGKYSDL
jgi:hypothetical protein